MNQQATPPTPDLPQMSINPSAIRPLLITFATSLALVVSTVATLFSFAANRDLAGWIVWIKSEDAVAFIGAVGTLASIAVLVWRTLSRTWRIAYLARRVDDKIAVVVEATPKPSVETILPPLAP